MRKIVSVLLLLAGANPTVTSAETATGFADDIALARDTLETLHPGYDRYTSRASLDALWAELEAKASRGLDRAQLYLALSAILAEIRCNHTKAELPEDMAGARNTEPVYLPFRFRLFDGRMYVDVSSLVELDHGEEILEIDGRPVADWLAAVAPLVPVDGDNEHVKPDVIAYDTEFMGGALDHFAPYLFGTTPDAKLTLRGLDGRVRRETVRRVSYVDYQALAGEQRYSSNFRDAVRFETIGDDGAYLAVDTFINYREPVDAVSYLQPYFERLRREGRRKLIVDLRNNGGGSDDAQTALLRYLITKPVLQSDGLLTRYTSIPASIRPHLSSWDREALDPDPGIFEPAGDGYYRVVAEREPVAPLPGAFDGELVVLVGAGNASGVTHMLAALRNHGGIRFVGGQTGGAPTGATAGVILFLTLPDSGIVIRVPAIRTLIANRDALPQRHGLAPDIAVEQGVEDWLAGKDPALMAAREALGL